jgi:hypothetical protein
MHKIQVYLVSNRLTVQTNLDGSVYSTENRKVYQRNINVYKGIDNTIEFDLRNGQNMKTPAIDQQIVVDFFDMEHKKLFSCQASHAVGTPHLFKVIISSADIEKISPQKLHMAAKLVNINTQVETIIYSGSQYELFATVDLLDGYNASPGIEETLSVFNYEYDANSFTSEIGNFGSVINEDYSTAPTKSVTIEIWPNPGFNADVVAFATNDKSTASSVTWKQLASFPIDADTHNPALNTFTVQGDYRFIKFVHSNGTRGVAAIFKVERSASNYTVTLVDGGYNYNIGEQIRIKGSKLDGLDSVNDVVITVTAIDTLDSKHVKTISGFIASGTAVAGVGIYERLTTESVNGTLDKIVLRD